MGSVMQDHQAPSVEDCECKLQTSHSRPITVSWVLPKLHTPGSGQAIGKLGLCFCPGKQRRTASMHIERDLQTDLSRLRDRFGIQCLVCLLNDAELRTYNLRDYGDIVRHHNVEFAQFPIIEGAAPDDIRAASEFINAVVRRLQQRQTVVMHCRGGVGRAGMIAACVMLQLKVVSCPDEAIREVRRLRSPTAVETSRQEDFVARYAKYLQICIDQCEQQHDPVPAAGADAQ